MGKALKYGFALTLTYLFLAHATDGGKLIAQGASSFVGIEKTFQGR